MNKTSIFGLLSSLSVSLAAGAPNDAFDWGSIKPSAKLTYTPCFDEFQCAKLLLPLDWKDETNKETVSIAMIKLPALVPEDDPTYAGAIFVNPGGPGGSGVDFLKNRGPGLQETIDKPGKKHYDMISFDPRGVGLSEPAVDCFPANSLGRTASVLGGLASGGLDLSPESLYYGHATAKAFGKRCEGGSGDVLAYVNTPSVARDMVAMVDQIAELRKEQAGDRDDADWKLELRSDDKPRLNYIGFSYGTILGNYFASLFPERIGRLVLDGVCNATDYANGPGWLTNTVDTDEMLEILFARCFNAGTELCNLLQPSDTAPSDISSRVWEWIDGLDENPIMTMTEDGAADIALRSATVRGYIGAALYGADMMFPKLAGLLQGAMDGDTEPFAKELLNASQLGPLSESCPVDGSSPSGAGSIAEALSAVACGDGDDVTDKDMTYWKDYLQAQVSSSKILGGAWAEIRFGCIGWRTRPNWSFKGPFTTPEASGDPSAPEAGKPAAPLLFVSNRWDPVTPLRAAQAMAANHPGAGVLVQEAMGHSALGHSTASDCTKKIVADYFDMGVVPEEEAVCDGGDSAWIESTPWEDITAADVDPEQYWSLQRRMKTKVSFRPLGV